MLTMLTGRNTLRTRLADARRADRGQINNAGLTGKVFLQAKLLKEHLVLTRRLSLFCSPGRIAQEVP